MTNGTGPTNIRLRHHQREIVMYSLTEQEMENLGNMRLLGAISLTLFGIFAGALVSYMTSPSGPTNIKNIDEWFVSSPVGFLLALSAVLSGILAGYTIWENKETKRNIKDRSQASGS